MSRSNQPRYTPDLSAFVAGSVFTSIAGLLLWVAYGGRLDAGALGVAIPVLLVLLGAGILVLRSPDSRDQLSTTNPSRKGKR